MSRSTRIWLGSLAAMVAIAGIAIFFASAPPPRDGTVAQPEPTPRRAPETNVAPAPKPVKTEVALASAAVPAPFIGTEACAKCHAERHASYLMTHHSKSLARVESGHQEQPGSYFHEPSQTLYEVLVSEQGIKHRESLRVPTSPTTHVSLPASELPVKYVMGSGAFAKGYLLEDRGFLLQSPVTWYRKPDTYSMAPGYDVPNHLATTRVISDQCVFCHAGIITRKNKNDHQFVIHELAIGCERCHGPGAEHARLYETKSNDAVHDSKIVNPANLDRMESESVCAQCHLQGDIVVDVQGKSIWDFAPGELLSQTRSTYKIDTPAKSKEEGAAEKTFVDHFDQLWQSACYQQSETLTCVTCHDPHHSEPVESIAVVQTQHCLKCHADESCRLDHEVRVQREQNVCYRCHMPRVDSEVPHTATTNHQIAVYPRSDLPETKQLADGPRVRELRSPLAEDLPSQRNALIAAAYLQMDSVRNRTDQSQLHSETLESVQRLSAADESDAELHALLSRVYRVSAEAALQSSGSSESANEFWKRAEQEALSVIRLEPQAVEIHKQALEVLQAKTYEHGDYDASVRYGVELVQSRRNAKDAYNLALAFAKLPRLTEAESLLRESIHIDARYSPPYRSLFKLYSSVDPPLAQQVQQAAMMLEAWEAAKRTAQATAP